LLLPNRPPIQSPLAPTGVDCARFSREGTIFLKYKVLMSALVPHRMKAFRIFLKNFKQFRLHSHYMGHHYKTKNQSIPGTDVSKLKVLRLPFCKEHKIREFNLLGQCRGGGSTLVCPPPRVCSAPGPLPSLGVETLRVDPPLRVTVRSEGKARAMLLLKSMGEGSWWSDRTSHPHDRMVSPPPLHLPPRGPGRWRQARREQGGGQLNSMI